jgi:hypothetical protein
MAFGGIFKDYSHKHGMAWFWGLGLWILGMGFE